MSLPIYVRVCVDDATEERCVTEQKPEKSCGAGANRRKTAARLTGAAVSARLGPARVPLALATAPGVASIAGRLTCPTVPQATAIRNPNVEFIAGPGNNLCHLVLQPDRLTVPGYSPTCAGCPVGQTGRPLEVWK
jgi:hypothetical protein